MITERRVVVTGMGVLSPVGNDLETFWSNLKGGVSGIGPITRFDASEFVSQIGGEVRDFEPKEYFKNPKDVRRTDLYSQFAMGAAKMALDHSGIDLDKTNLDQFGVIVGSGIGGLETLEKQIRTYVEKGPSRISPFMIPMMISNMASGLISMEYGLGGPNMSVVTACATANNSIGEAWRMIKYGEAEAFVAGGTEASIVPIGIGGFCSMRALSTRNDDPTAASRPFDIGRDGFVMGEGAGVVILEELEHAKARGAEIHAEIIGYGLSADAYHMSAPQPDGLGAARCMRNALKQANINPEQVDYVNAHGTSTGLGDICETKALKAVFGDHAKDGMLVSSTKSMTGHLLGAAGGVELMASILAIRDQVIAPTINLENQDPECDLDYCANTAREAKVDVALSNSFGFGGHNATLLVSKFNG